MNYRQKLSKVAASISSPPPWYYIIIYSIYSYYFIFIFWTTKILSQIATSEPCHQLDKLRKLPKILFLLFKIKNNLNT